MTRTLRLSTLLLTLALPACGDKADDDAGGGDPADTDGDTDGRPECEPDVDADCDGVPDDEDCAPEDARTYPGATELPYDGVDNDCAGDGDLTDVDGDGYDGPVGVGPDCNDNNPDVYPGAEEVCYNGIDENCDGEPVAGEDESPDCDGDGYDGYGVGAPDCDDTDASVNPGAAEVWYDGADGDCSGHIESDYDADYDGDDHVDHGGTDCDDADPLTYGTEADGSSRAEVLDGVDRNCDGNVDLITIFDASTAWYANTMSNDGLFGAGLVEGDDYDGDGHTDLVVGGPWSDSDDENCLQDGNPNNAALCSGWVQVMLLDGTDGTPGDVAHATYEGAPGNATTGAYGDWAGYDLANLGDQNGDGWAEIAVGHPLNGDIKVLDGQALQAGGSVSASDVFVTATAAGFMGFEVAALDDVDGDGKAELAGGINDKWANVGGGDLDLRVWSSQDMAGGGS
ncbi:MAG: putative metal-binding motif-containing protein, partial [Myxococcota bacterium]|nr:putative metal-binding motif-containing protein [Myxococcota bacterium]